MKNEDLVSRLNFIISEIERIDKENHTEPDEPTDPRIVKLLDEGTAVQTELDLLVRETFRERPATLARWDEIMHMCDDNEQQADS